MYNIHVNIFISGKNKVVRIHKKSCGHFKKNPSRKNIYTYNYSADNLTEAIEYASKDSLEWHAKIRFCSHCFKKGSRIECDF